jgi:hypothetical protein
MSNGVGFGEITGVAPVGYAGDLSTIIGYLIEQHSGPAGAPEGAPGWAPTGGGVGFGVGAGFSIGFQPGGTPTSTLGKRLPTPTLETCRFVSRGRLASYPCKPPPFPSTCYNLGEPDGCKLPPPPPPPPTLGKPRKPPPPIPPPSFTQQTVSCCGIDVPADSTAFCNACSALAHAKPTTSKRRCPPGYHWNPSRERCEAPHHLFFFGETDKRPCKC